MNALLLPRLIKPILGSGEDEPRIFAVSAEPGSFAPPLRLLDSLSLPAPEPGFVVAPERPVAEMEARPAEHAPSPPAASAPAPTEPADLVLPPPAAWHPPPPPPAPEERITVESLGQLAIRVTGTGQDDRLFGGPGDDRLDGLAGDDILVGSPGRDLLYGGAGHDTIRYDRMRAEVGLDARFQRVSLENGEDQYDGIEVVDLRDGDWILTTGDPAALVQRLFLAATGHAPSAVEMVRETAALQAGSTAEGLAARLAAGAGEAVQLRVRAALDAPRGEKLDQPIWLPDAEAVLLTRMAELALGGTPGRDAFLHWLDELEGGRSPASVAVELLATPDGQAHAPHLDAQAIAATASAWML